VKDSIVKNKSYAFAGKIVRLARELKQRHEFELSKQVLRAGTSIGANVEEALAGISRRDFIAKMSIASKEARETHYWLRLVKTSQHGRGRETKNLQLKTQNSKDIYA